MKRNRILLLALLLLAVLAAVAVNAQDIVPTPGDEPDPNANISFPPPVYVLRGEISVLGSAALEGMTSYFIEFRPLAFPDADATEETDPAATEEVGTEDDEDENPWFPATLPNSQPVVDGTLGRWNTATAPDGLYELRLVVNVAGQAEPTVFRVSPLRIENEGDFAVEIPDPEPEGPRPTLQPSPTPPDTTPLVEVTRSSVNVREGDSVDYPIIGVAFQGDVFRVVGISSGGSGWYLIELEDGLRGWISPSVVSVSGDLRSVPRVDPPPPPFTPTPLPTNTPEAAGDLIADAFTPDPNPPVCNEPFEVLVNIRNVGNAQTLGSVDVIIRDVHVASGQVQTQITTIPVPQLAPGASFVVGGTLTVSTFFGEEHRIEVIVDPNNLVLEANDGNNTRTFNYTLDPGSC